MSERERLVFVWDGQPPEAGWYVVVHCYEVEEGAFSGVAFWDGTTWRDARHDAITQFHQQRFASEPDARMFEREHGHELEF